MKCLNCGQEMQYVPQQGIPGWAIVLAIFTFPLGLIF